VTIPELEAELLTVTKQRDFWKDIARQHLDALTKIRTLVVCELHSNVEMCLGDRISEEEMGWLRKTWGNNW
jgi:hypothetical protein